MKQAAMLSCALAVVHGDAVSEPCEWISDNMRGMIETKFCRDGEAVSSLSWQQQWGYGLIGVQFQCHGSAEVFYIGSNDHGGPDKHNCTGRKGMTALQFNEQWGYGLINARTWCGDSDTEGFDQANDWEDGDWLAIRQCPLDEVVAGFGGHYQDGYGLVNICHICRPRQEECKVLSQTIVAMECAQPGGAGACEGRMDETDPAEAFSVVTDCDACDFDGTMHCSNAFSYQRTHTMTTESSEIQTISNEIDIGVSFEAGEDTFIEKTTETATFSYKHSWGSTWESSRSQSLSTQSTISSDCDFQLQPKSKANLTGMILERNLIADIRLTLRTVTTCGTTNSTHDATVTINHVPTSSLVTHCKVQKEPCDAGAFYV